MRSAIKNTKTSYGSVARWLHWSVALLFLAGYCAVYYRHWFTEKETPENWTALQLHLSLGMTIGVFVILRVIWTAMNDKPEPPAGKPWEHHLARLGHFMLYFFMIAMPLTGYLGTGVATEFFKLFTVPKFEDTSLFQLLVVHGLGMTFEEFESYIDFFHKRSGRYLVWVLILIHVAAAAYHHYVKRDDTLLRMLKGGRRAGVGQ